MSLFTVHALMSPSAIGSLLHLFFTENPLGKLIDSSICIVNDIKGVIVAQFVVVFPPAFSYLTALFANILRVYEEIAMEVGLSRIGYPYRVLIPRLEAMFSQAMCWPLQKLLPVSVLPWF